MTQQEYENKIKELENQIAELKMGLNGQVKINLGNDYKEVVEVFEK